MIDATPTPATLWQRQRTQGELWKLPGSGNLARLRRVSLMAMAAQVGKIPNPLKRDVLKFLAVSGKQNPPEEEQIRQYQQNNKAFVAAAELVLVEPRLVTDREPNYEDGEIGPDDLHDRDYTWIFFSFLGGDEQDRAQFRVGGSAAAAASVAEDGDPIRLSAD